MDVHASGGNERLLRRVIALLVALALLAERAAGRSWPVRSFVLWILRRAETAAWEFAFEMAGTPSVIEGDAAIGDGHAHALSLAARLRALAAALAALLPVACRLDRRPARGGRAPGHIAPGRDRTPGGWRRKPNDTS